MSEVIITPDHDGLYDDWFDPPMEIKMKMNEDIVINTSEYKKWLMYHILYMR